MRISKNLNIVIKVDTAEKGEVFVHSSPISRDVFEKYYNELGQVFTESLKGVDQAHMALSAPQIAYPSLKAISKKLGTWDGVDGVKAGLINEIIRLTTVIVANNNGWDSLPFNVALKNEALDEDDEAEILSNLVFFTVISKVAPKDLRSSFLEIVGSLRDWEYLSLTPLEYINGLPILTEEKNTKKKVA